MARPLRIEYDGAVYHVTSRGNERKNIFRDDEDRLLFLDILKKVNEKHNWLCHAYCLINNHYHLVIETPDGNLSKGMRQLNGVYTQTFNKRHDRVGHIDHVRKHEGIKEIPRSQRYVNRPALAQLFKADTMKNKLKRNKKITEAVTRFGYSQNEISNHLGMHYSTISRLLKDAG